MDVNKPRMRWPRDVKIQPAGWYPDPWELTGDAKVERWWTGLSWTERTRLKREEPVRDIVTLLPEERKTDDD